MDIFGKINAWDAAADVYQAIKENVREEEDEILLAELNCIYLQMLYADQSPARGD